MKIERELDEMSKVELIGLGLRIVGALIDQTPYAPSEREIARSESTEEWNQGAKKMNDKILYKEACQSVRETLLDMLKNAKDW